MRADAEHENLKLHLKIKEEEEKYKKLYEILEIKKQYDKPKPNPYTSTAVQTVMTKPPHPCQKGVDKIFSDSKKEVKSPQKMK